MAGGIFISYRREDSQHAAGRLVDRLGQTFRRDQLFMDVDAIEPGLDFVEVLNQKLASCDVLLALIGPGWLEARDPSGLRRLDNPSDFVRLEIETALRRNIRVIPALLDDASLPQEESLPAGLKRLARRQAVSIAHERFAADAERLVRSLARVVEPNRRPASAAGAGAPLTAPVPARTGLSHRLIAWAYALLALPVFGALNSLLFRILVAGLQMVGFTPEMALVFALPFDVLLTALLVAAVGFYCRRSRGPAIARSELVLYWIGGSLPLAFGVGSIPFLFLPRSASGALAAISFLPGAAVALAGLVLMILDLRRHKSAHDAAKSASQGEFGLGRSQTLGA